MENLIPCLFTISIMTVLKSHRLIALVILTIMVSYAYGNSFKVPWHLDDIPNILNNTYLHLERMDFESIKNTFFTNARHPSEPGKKIYRPISCFTFALNWYSGRDNVFGYHMVNTGIHILTAFLLYLTIRLLYKTPGLTGLQLESRHIALTAALAWALNPVQTQAVTYIVQRMAQLGCFFYLLGLFLYLKGRLSTSPNKIGMWFGAVVAYLCAMGSKENSAILPMAIILVELIFFNTVWLKNNKKLLVGAAIVSVILVLALGAVVFSRDDSLFFMARYESRPFSMVERLLTQPQIVLFYLSQLFFPLPSRLSIAHDVTISSSLFSNWFTLPSILLIIGICCWAMLRKNKIPIFSFGIIFYFLNHLIESTIIPLELVFEHRNYLPSLFLFWPLTHLIFTRVSTHINRAATWGGIVLLTIALASAAFVRNNTWQSANSLWTDAMIKAPNQARPLTILATELAWGKESRHPKRNEMALHLFEQALEKEVATKNLKAAIIGNMAAIHLNIGNNDKALHLYEKSLGIDPNALVANYNYALALLKARQWKKAVQQADHLLSLTPESVAYYIIKGQAFIWDGLFEEAVAVFDAAAKIDPFDYKVYLYRGIALNRLNRLEAAKKNLQNAFTIQNNSFMVYLALIENSIRAKNEKEIEIYIKKMFIVFDKEQIERELKRLSTQFLSVPVSEILVFPVIMKRLKNYGR